MRDPIDALTHLSPGEPVEQPPAAEIRRRGNALRRRRTATIAVGALVAIAAVVVPLSLLNRPDLPVEPATDDPTSTQTQEPTDAVVTQIPDDFPIETGLSTRDVIEHYGPAARGEIGTELEPFTPCGEQIWPADGVDTLDVAVSAPEWWETRQLATYASADEAVAVLEAAREALDGCSSYPGGDAQTLEVLDGDTGYDDVTFGFSSSSGMPGGTVVQLMRVGSAVVLLSASGEYTADSIQSGADDLTWASQELATHMCVFTEAGCGGEGGTTLDELPIDRYLPTGDEIERVDPHTQGADVLEICGEEIWPVHALQSYGVMAIGPEQSEARFVSEWGEADLAAAVLENARTATEGCDADGTQMLMLEGDTGYDTLTYAIMQAGGQPGGEVVQLMRVHQFVLVSMSGGEYTLGSAQAAADELTAQSADLAVEMNEVSGG